MHPRSVVIGLAAILGISYSARAFPLGQTSAAAAGTSPRTVQDTLRSLSVGEAAGPPGIRVRAEAHLSTLLPKHLGIKMQLRNRSAQAREVEYGSCAMRILLHPDPTRSGRPAWNSREQLVRLGNEWTRVVCTAILNSARLQPGETYSDPSWRTAVRADEILGDSLPTGRYYVTAVLILRGADTVRIPAGAVELPR
jgi:hypothetical protein